MTIKFFKNVDEYQLFFSAVENNNLHVVEQVIPYLSSINRYHQKGEILCTALAVAAGNGYLEMTRLLLANKANFDAPVLQCLFSFPEGNPVIVSEDEFKEPKEGELLFRYPVISNPLMMAAEKGQKETFELLKEAGANLHQLTLNGRPIFVSVEKGNLAMLSLYLEAGIDVNEKMRRGIRFCIVLRNYLTQ